ncbi:MAG TPA: hypothetical protein VIU93_02555 [Gallionellaceae bacterium]
MSEQRATAAQEVARAVAEWKKAPIHIKTMAGPYVVPLLDAISAMQRDQATLAGHMLQWVQLTLAVKEDKFDVYGLEQFVEQSKGGNHG